MDISQIVPCTERAFEKGRGDGIERRRLKRGIGSVAKCLGLQILLYFPKQRELLIVKGVEQQGGHHSDVLSEQQIGM